MAYWQNLVAALRGRAPAPPPSPATIDEAQRLVRAYGASYASRVLPNEQKHGIRTPYVPASLRWLPEDIESVWGAAEIGQFYELASLVRGMRLNGTIDGLMTQRQNIVRLPFMFVGDPWLCEELRGVPAKYTPDGVMVDPGVPGAFEAMCPAEGLKSLLYTGIMAGLAPFEMVPRGGPDPVMEVRDLHFLRYDWGGRVYTYQGGQDVYEVRPGDGTWGLYTPGGADRPWQGGAWLPCAFPFVAALASLFDRLRWQALLADPLKWIKASPGASQAYLVEMDNFIKYQWARAPGIALPPGYEAGYSENTGEGYEVYCQQEARADRMVQIALAGQVVSVDGGKGFSNATIWDAISEAFIQETASGLARCLTDHVIGPWVERRYGLPRSRAPKLLWDVRSPGRRRQDADFYTAAAAMVIQWDAALRPRGQMVDVPTYMARNAIDLPVMPIGTPQAAEAPPLPAGTIDVAPEAEEIEVEVDDAA